MIKLKEMRKKRGKRRRGLKKTVGQYVRVERAESESFDPVCSVDFYEQLFERVALAAVDPV